MEEPSTEFPRHLVWLADSLGVLSTPRRLDILRSLAVKPANVGEIAGRFDLSQSVASQNLAKLKSVGLVTTERQRQKIIYRANPAALEELRRGINQIFPEAA